MGQARPELIIISGANGVGKTTFAKPYVKSLGYTFLNADEIAKKLDNDGFSHTMIKAGRIFFTRLEKNILEKNNLVIETTLSGSYINKVATKASKQGYSVKVIYIFVDNVKLCIERVRARVIKGGHNVPIEDIRRRFHRSISNFRSNFQELSDSWILLYNGNENYQQVAIGVKTKYSVEDEILFKQFLALK